MQRMQPDHKREGAGRLTPRSGFFLLLGLLAVAMGAISQVDYAWTLAHA